MIDTDKFKKDGFIIYNPKINYNTIINARESLKKIITICQNHQYQYVRVYDDYSKKINIAGIEMIFDEEIIDQNVINLIQESNIINIAKKILNDEDLILVLSRYHVTQKYTHLGIWHRDGKPNSLDSLQLNIYLYDETGMEIVKDSHTRHNFELEEQVLNTYRYKDLPSQTPITVKAGDVCVFNPSLIHRGKTHKDRVHLHFRFMRKKQLNKKFFSISKNYLTKLDINNDLLEVLNNSLDYENRELLKKYVFKRDVKSKFMRLIRYMIHNFLFFLPIQNKLNSFFNVRPCLNKRSILKIK